MIDINIEEIMKEIRAEIKSKGYTNDQLSFGEVEELRRLYSGEFDAREFDDWLQIVRNNYYVEEHPVLWGNSFGKKLKYRIKSAARKCISFYIVPIVQKQNEYNKAVAKVLNQVDAFIAENKKVEVLQRQVDELTKKIENLEGKK